MGKNNEKDLSIQGMWFEFLRLNGLQPGKIPAIQELEMRKTFYMACGMLHTKIRDDIAELPQEMAVLVMETQMIEIAEYLSGQAQKDQARIIGINKPKITH